MSLRLDGVLDTDRSIRPLVRPTRSQTEIDLLPPFGDPEVYLLGEVTTYLLVCAAVNAVLERLGH